MNDWSAYDALSFEDIELIAEMQSIVKGIVFEETERMTDETAND
jgi:hypothetical protein